MKLKLLSLVAFGITVCTQNSFAACNSKDGTKYTITIQEDSKEVKGDTIYMDLGDDRTLSIDADGGQETPTYFWSFTDEEETETTGAAKDYDLSSLAAGEYEVFAGVEFTDGNSYDEEKSEYSKDCLVEKTLVVKAIISETVKKAADGTTADERTKIGVCEEVTFYDQSLGAANWTASAGKPKSFNGTIFSWKAPEVEGDVTITAKITGQDPVSMTMSVIKPTGADWKKRASVSSGYTIGNVGAQMTLEELTLTPATVNFENIKVKEVSGPASNITGDFRNVNSSTLYHNASSYWISFGSDNKSVSGSHDLAGQAPPGSPAGSAGSFDWVIPMNYRDKSKSSGNGFEFTTVTQSFDYTASGTCTVEKDDKSICKVTRAKNQTSCQ